MTRRVVLSLMTEQQEYQRLQAKDARASAERLGFELELLYAENDAALQLEQVSRAVRRPAGERPAAIVVETVSGEGLECVARDAVAAGIGWLILNREVPYLDALRRARRDLPIALVSTDQEEIGRIQGRQFRALLPRGGSVLYVQGPPDTSAARDRRGGVEQACRGAAIRLELLSGDWTEASGEGVVASWLQAGAAGFRPDVVGCQNDAMAIGARRAVAGLRPEWLDLRFTGVDGLPEGGRKAVDSGLLAATVVTPSIAGCALERLAAWLRDGRLPPREVLLEPHSYPPESAVRP